MRLPPSITESSFEMSDGLYMLQYTVLCNKKYSVSFAMFYRRNTTLNRIDMNKVADEEWRTEWQITHEMSQHGMAAGLWNTRATTQVCEKRRDYDNMNPL